MEISGNVLQKKLKKRFGNLQKCILKNKLKNPLKIPKKSLEIYSKAHRKKFSEIVGNVFRRKPKDSSELFGDSFQKRKGEKQQVLSKFLKTYSKKAK